MSSSEKVRRCRDGAGRPLPALERALLFRAVCLLLLVLDAVSEADRSAGDAMYDRQPRIQSVDGHMIFVTAADRNITFSPRGSGRIMVDGNDIGAILLSARQSVVDLKEIKEEHLPGMRHSILGLQSNVSSFQQVTQRLEALERIMIQMSAQLQTTNNGTRFANLDTNQRDLRRRISQQTNRINTITQNLQRNECSSNPCFNGATCEDRYNAYQCECPPNWKGPRCDVDVNECGEFAGTGIGCQNGATCTNTPGGYTCQCTPDWFGIHCTQRHDDCRSSSQYELCGHGTCIDQSRGQSGQANYICLCDQGWTKRDNSPACVVDVDECRSGRSPCFQHPTVMCINTPGSFQCGPCPPGYTGDGANCQDVNECLSNNGGCSMNPHVMCVNTIGSRQCGSCPPGYQGNGELCIYVGMCNIDNGGCSLHATCSQNLAISTNYRLCICRPGYTGNGVGPEGCVAITGGSGSVIVQQQPSADPCNPNPCLRGGACMVLSSGTFRCLCPLGYSGSHCQEDIDDCASGPCQNGGTCIDQTNSFVCNCAAPYTGNHCELTQDVCGQYFNSPTGQLHYPRDPMVSYTNNRTCAWVITTTSNKVLNLTFTEFHLEGSSPCAYDFLQVNDGHNAGARSMGRFCGTRPPGGGTLISTHNAIYLWFFSDHSVTGDGFQLEWTSIDPVCGGDLPATDVGIIQSPGYPHQYPINRDCVWIARVPPGKRIQLIVGAVQLEEHLTCNYDFLEIRDGARDTDHQLAKYCGRNNTPGILTTTGSFARLYFHSDVSETDSGFHIAYHSTPGVPGCGGTYTADKGILQSPHYPNQYINGLVCDYVIRAPPDEHLQLTFTDFHLESHDRCRYDYLEIFDGPDDSADSLGRYCGRNLPVTYTSTSNFFMLKLVTDASRTRGGFSATYKVLCGGSFTGPSGVLHSPYYPNPYPGFGDCTYVIRQPPGKAVQLDFQAFDIESAYNNPTPGNCPYDALEIRDGDSSDSPLFGRFCGTEAPERLLSTHNFLWLKFTTDNDTHNRGFLANYSIIDNACGGIIENASSGEIGAPAHPSTQGSYMLNTECHWILKPPGGRLMRLTFNAFILEGHGSCIYDYVAVYDNTTTVDPNKLIGKYCGSTLPPVLTTSTNLALVVFHSDHSVAVGGFSLQYTSLDSSLVCGGNFYTPLGALSSPLYPRNYPNNRDCIWKIKVAVGKQITLNITDFRLETGSNCRHDYLQIRNGGTDTSPLIQKLCGGTLATSVITSHGNQMWLRFRSDSSITFKGFYISWESSLTGCGGELTSSSGVIESPNYPGPCSSSIHSIQCTWRITVNPANLIRINVIELDTAGTPPWCFNGLQLYDGPDARSRQLASLCGNQHPDPVSSTGREVHIRFRCPWFMNDHHGFRLSYSTNCNTLTKGRRGTVESLEFPNPYPANRNCTYRIQAPRGNRINMTFAQLHLEDHNNCAFDYVEIYDPGTRTTSARSIGKFCGMQSTPLHLVSDTNNIEVRFVSDYSVPGNGFLMEWVATGCGGLIRKPYGNFTTPNYPGLYPVSLDCAWEIVAEYGESIDLVIEDYDIESSGGCRYDSLKVYSGRDDTGIPLTSLCHRSEGPVHVPSTNNHMYVYFSSDISRNGRGFSAHFTTSLGGCGGTVNSPSGAIHSRNYPGRYTPGDDCQWLVQVADGHTVDMVLLDNIQISPFSANCSLAYLAIYDGPTENDALLLRFCGNRAPTIRNFRSASNQVLVVMKAHNTTGATGFQLNYTTACGALLYADQSGAIDMSSAKTMRNCTWIIRARNPGDRVSLTFTFLHGRALRNCSSEYVAVFDDGDVPRDVNSTGDGGATSDNSNGVDVLELGRFCSAELPPTITSRGAALRVFAKNPYNSLHFRAVYYESSTGCGGDLTAVQGTFTSPEYPNSYPLEIECEWTISASAGNGVSLSFRSFNLEDTEYCNGDYVEVRADSSSGPMIGKYCGANLPSNLTGDGPNRLWIKFRSDTQGTAPGFVASYALRHGMQLTGPEGTIASPLYPRNFYSPGTFRWTITVDTGNTITLTFVEVIINAFVARCFTSITVYDGADSTAPQLIQLCGGPVPDAVASTGNQMHIEFKARMHSYTGPRFLLRWNATQPPEPVHSDWSYGQRNATGCGGSLFVNTSDYLQLTSPGFPANYDDNRHCLWTVTSPLGSSLAVYFETLEMESWGGCSDDYLQLSEGTTTGGTLRNVGQYCSRAMEDQTITIDGNLLQLDFITDTSWNERGFKITLHTVCGGNLTAPSGVITSPWYPSNYLPNRLCTWLVTVRPGRTISVLFTDFELQGSMPVCSNDYITLRNGMSTESPILGSGKYCGSTMPAGSLQTTGNHLTVQFRSNGIGSYKGFLLQYQEVSLECGGTIVLSEENSMSIVQSPNYPLSYPPNTICEWRLVAPSRRRLLLEFQDHFDLPFDQACHTDYVLVTDGGTVNSPLLARVCGSIPLSSIQSSSNNLFIRFSSESPHPSIGFKAQIRLAECGGTVVAERGLITSPGYPNGYPGGQNCQWIVRGPPGHFLIISLTHLQMRISSNCSDEYVQIRDWNATGLLLGQHCGRSTRPIPAVHTADNVAYISFRSVRDSPFPGFRLQFESSVAVCGGDLDTPTGILSSPNYPAPYPTHRRCRWAIRAPRGRKIRFRFSKFELEASENDRHCNDILFMSNRLRSSSYPGIESPTIRWCGIKPPGTEVESSSSNAEVTFLSNEAIVATGFQASYDTDLPVDCGGDLPLPSGNVTSPGFGAGGVNHSTLCHWTLDSSSHNGSVLLRLEHFSLEDANDCYFDSLRLYNGLEDDNNAAPILNICGNHSRPHAMVIPAGQLSLVLFTDISITSQGFFLTYALQDCGGVLGEDGGLITSPGYPSGYQNDVHCSWVVTVQEGQQVEVTFETLQLEESLRCTNDYVLLRNGDTLTSPIIGTYCGSTLPATIRSQRHLLMVEFHTNTEIGDRGFRLRTTPVTGGCGGTLHGDSGQLISLNYPGHYPHNMECEWILEADPGYIFNMTFMGRFDIEMHSTCDNDFLEGFDWVIDHWVSTGKNCGSILPDSLNSFGNRYRLLFRTNDAVTGNGFNISWTKHCGGVFMNGEGSFSNPGYPEKYANNMDCKFYILPPFGHYVTLTFDPVFVIENASDCRYDFVEVFAGNLSTGQSLIKACGLIAPSPISIKGSALVRFYSDYVMRESGFRITYKVSECGGNLTAGNGVIEAPTVPDIYHNNMNCTWTIYALPNRVLKLKFEMLDVETSYFGNGCHYDSVSVYDGNDTQSRLLGRYCGHQLPTPPTLVGTSNVMSINFVTDINGQHRGFRIAYWNTFGERDGCGGVFMNASGTIRSLDYDRDGKYESQLDCSWVIMGVNLRPIQLTFQGTFDIEKPPNRTSCPWDYLEIRDGASPNSPLIEQRLCGRDLPPPVTSSGSRMRIRFVSDDTHNFAGFVATFQSVEPDCGGLVNLTGSEPVTIKSPGYPSNYPTSKRCSWTVIPSGTSDELMVHVNDFDLEDSINCRKDYLRFTPTQKYAAFGMNSDLATDQPGPSHTFCGHRVVANHYYPADMIRALIVDFVSDSDVTGLGFSATFSRPSCNRIMDNEQGAVINAFPNGISNATDCVTHIRVANGSTITLQMTEFVMFPYDVGVNCDNSFVEVRNGPDAGSPLLSKWCPFSSSYPISSNQSSLYVRMHAGSALRNVDFRAAYYSTNQGSGCGGKMVVMGHGYGSRYIMSPNYPGNYSRNATCVWEVSSNVELQWEFIFRTLDLGPIRNGTCSANYLEIYEGTVVTPDKLIISICPGDSMPRQRTSGNAFILRYVTDITNRGQGFYLAIAYSINRNTIGDEPVEDVAKT